MSGTSSERLPARFDRYGAVEYPDQDGRGGSVALRNDGTAWNRTGLTASWEPLLELPYDALAHSLTTMRDATAALIFEAQKQHHRVLDLEARVTDLERMLRVSREDAARLREQVRASRHSAEGGERDER